MIERYLAELGPQLPVRGRARRRILAEAENHLLESAAALGSEAEAIRRFGPPEVVAARFAQAGVVQATRTALFALALAGAGFAGAGILAEATLPPAPWPFADATPPALAWKLDAARVAYGIAFAAGLTGLVFHRRLRAALPLTGLGALALAFAAAVGAVETLERSSLYRGLEIPGAYSAAEASLLAAWACALALLALAPAGLALYRLRGAAGPAPPE